MVVGGQKEEVLMSCDHWAATTVLSSTIATTDLYCYCNQYLVRFPNLHNYCDHSSTVLHPTIAITALINICAF